MQKKLSDFAAGLGLRVSPNTLDVLIQYAELVWQKKDQLNLTSVQNKEEIATRHLADGLMAAYGWNKFFKGVGGCAADMGSGAGYIGLTLAVVCPQVQVTLVESLHKRCAFLNWVVLKLGLSNVTVQNIRLGQEWAGSFDFVTERAMGQLTDVLPLIAPNIKQGGLFAAYQSTKPDDTAALSVSGLQQKEVLSYTLPQEDKERYLVIFSHGYIQAN